MLARRGGVLAGNPYEVSTFLSGFDRVEQYLRRYGLTVPGRVALAKMLDKKIARGYGRRTYIPQHRRGILRNFRCSKWS